MRNVIIASIVCLVAGTASADFKPGQYAGIRKCVGSTGALTVDVTSKKTIGVATCKGEIKKELLARGVCEGHKRFDKVLYSFTFGSDRDPNQTHGEYHVFCN